MDRATRLSGLGRKRTLIDVMVDDNSTTSLSKSTIDTIVDTAPCVLSSDLLLGDELLLLICP